MNEGRTDSERSTFKSFHDEGRLRARKRLYMTATPRIYTQRSKRKLAEQGIEVVDMGDHSVYGPQFHHLPFSQAVEHGMLIGLSRHCSGYQQRECNPRSPSKARRFGNYFEAEEPPDNERNDPSAGCISCRERGH